MRSHSNRAQRRRAERLIRKEPEMIDYTNRLMKRVERVLRKEFGFGDTRIKRFIDAMVAPHED